MHTPSAALAWEFWRRHRARIITIVGVVLAFALVYPKLCALAGFNLSTPDALDAIVNSISKQQGFHSASQIVHMLCLILLACGPAGAMVLSLLCVTWMFTLTAPDPKTKDPMTFPTRLFTLPVSTPFLFWWLVLAGQAAVVLLYGSWFCLVRLPHLEMFAVYQNCFGWMTLLALAQGIVWALAGWPLTRALMLIAVFFCFSLSLARFDIYNSSSLLQPFFNSWSLLRPFLRGILELVLPALFILGLVLGRAGLQKMRHGQWQGWNWDQILSRANSRGEMRGPKRFASPAQAQSWFEWRRFARRLCFYVAGLALLPLLIHVLVWSIASLGLLQDETTGGFAAFLLVVPLLIYWFAVVPSSQPDLPFMVLRPMTNGQMMMAMLKASAIGTMLSWALVLVAMYALSLLGNFYAVQHDQLPPRAYWPIFLLGMMLLTWRMVAVNLWYMWCGQRRLAGLPALILPAYFLCAIPLSILSQDAEFWNSFCLLLPGLLAVLVAAKFLLAFLAFRVSLKRGLLAPSALRAYLGVWFLLVAGLLTALVIPSHLSKELILPSSLAIALLTPLARIGFCPISLAWNRHA
jgi:hypothetical protein